MSADSPKRPAVRCVPAVVPPQVVSDRSLIDSVAGFINDVTLTSQPLGDPKEQVLWVRFENMADVSDPTCGEDWELEGNVPPPLVIILGFGSGIKVYALPAHGEAVEVLGWRHGVVKALRILPSPLSADDEMANEPIDQFVEQRPLMALCDSSSTTCSSQYCSVSFISLKNGAQVKMIKFKNPVVDILANRTSIVVTFQEKIAVFDARNLEDRLSITSCHPSPGINPNPVALGGRWMAYSEWKLLPSKRSGGGCDCEGVSSYTATVLNAAKSLGKGLRELGEQVAAGLTGTAPNGGSASSSKSGSFESSIGELKQPGLVTIVDIKYAIKDTSPTTGSPITVTGTDPIIAHFIAHSDAVVALEFDPSGMLLLTADKRGHDFHVFRIQPHPAGSHLAAVHHLYVLHRGDTSAKIQDIAFSLDSRWVAVSSLRGTTHVFPITPYGGPAGVRTHGSLHVVNRLSRFHRSAGLTVDGRSSSPILHAESSCNQSCMPYNNTRTPPFPRPVVMHALAQIRQPSALGTPPGSAQNSYARAGSGRQRLSSVSDDTGKEMRVSAVFAKARSWLLEPPNVARETSSHRMQKKAVDSIFLMAGHGALIQYDLDVKLASNIAKDKISDDTAIELEVEAKAQWYLGRRENSPEIQPPLPRDNWLLRDPSYPNSDNETNSKDVDDQSDRWLSQVEIITHAGPHRRLWMGPQFVFKTYNTPSGAPLSHIDLEAVEIGISSMANRPGRSSPMNMPVSGASKGAVPVLIESGSYSEFPSSFEQSPKLMDRFRHGHMESDFSFAHGDTRLKEDLADAMRESPSVSQKDTGLTSITMSSSPQPTTTTATMIASKTKAGASTSPDIDMHLKPLGTQVTKMKSNQPQALVEKVVNPLGTVTTITRSPSDNDLDSSHSTETGDDYVIHENCDEALFRPVVAIYCDDAKVGTVVIPDPAHVKPPETVGSELIVPVIEETKPRVSPGADKMCRSEVKSNENVTKINREKAGTATELESSEVQIAKFNEMSLANRKINKNSKALRNERETDRKKDSQSQLTNPSSSSDTRLKSTGKQDKPKSKSRAGPVLNINSMSNEDKQIDSDRNTQNISTDSVDCPSAVTTLENPSKGEEKIMPSNESFIASESTKGDESATVTTSKGDHSLGAAASFDTLLNASKKVIEKAEKVLGPGKKIEKISTKTAKKELPDDLLNILDCKASATKKESRLVAVESISKSNRPAERFSITSEISPADTKSKVGSAKNKRSKEETSVINTEVEAKKAIKLETPADEVGLNFYEKFAEKDIQYVEFGVDTLPPLQKVQLRDLEFPSLAASLSEVKFAGKKLKGSSVSPKQSQQKVRKEAAIEKSESIAYFIDADAIISPISPKKRSKKNSIEEIKAESTLNCDCDASAGIVSCAAGEFVDSVKSEVFPENLRCAENLSQSGGISSQLPFELISSTKYAQPVLPPLENFDLPKFDELYYEMQPENVSLINFESPVNEERAGKGANKMQDARSEKPCKRKQNSSPSLKYTKDNLILALCGSLHEGDIDESTTSTKSAYSGSNERLNEAAAEIDEQYLSLEPILYQENTPWTSSSEDTEESTRHVTKKHSRSRHHASVELVRREDDEELRPLIGGTNSACSMASSTCNTTSIAAGGKRQGSTDEDDNKTIALEIAKAIIDSLPDSNHSDSSDQGNVLQSSEDYDMPPTPSPPSNDTVCTAPAKKAAEQIGGGARVDPSSAVSAKKKSKRKKR